MRISDWSSDVCSSDRERRGRSGDEHRIRSYPHDRGRRPSGSRCMTDWRRIFSLREAGVYYALLLLLGVLAALAAARRLPLYLSRQNLGHIAYPASLEIGRALWWDPVCMDGLITVRAGILTKQN